MNLENKDVIIFNDEMNDNYTPGVSNSVKVEDLLNELNLLPKLRSVTKDIKCVQKLDGTVLIGGHIKLSIQVEYNPETLDNN